MTAQLRLPTGKPAKSAFFRSIAIGRMVFSTGFLLISAIPQKHGEAVEQLQRIFDGIAERGLLCDLFG